MRDLRRALAPLGPRARFWGYQTNVAAIYPRIDYLMTGLPEKEALGLNALEAQACGTPVLAPDGPPFDENVATGKTGYLYPDPRKDGGAGFEDLLRRLVALPRPIDPRDAPDCLREFSFERFVERVQSAVAALPAA